MPNRSLYPSPITPLQYVARRVLTPSNAWRAGQYMGNVARNLFNSGRRSRPSGRRQTNRSSGQGLQVYGGQGHRPYNTQYRKRRAPRRKRIAARRYYRKFAKALRTVGGVALQKALFNTTVSGSVTGTPQSFIATHLYSYNSITSPLTQETGVRDVKQIRDSMTNTFYTDDVGSHTKFMIDHAILDMTLRNSGGTSLEIDLYHIVYGDNNEYGAFASYINGSAALQPSLTTAPSGRIIIQDRGATFFDLPTTLSNGYMRILSKEKIFLESGASTTFQYKLKKPHSITASELSSDNTYFAKKGLTHTWVAVYKNVTGTPVEQTGTLTLGSTRSYAWRVDGITQAGTATLAD